MTDTVKVGLKVNLKNYESLALEIEREMPSGVDQAQADQLVRDLDALASRFGRNDPPTREAIDAYRKRVLTAEVAASASPGQMPPTATPAAPAPAPVDTSGTTGEYRKDTGPKEVPTKIFEKEKGRPPTMPPVKQPQPAREEKKAPEQPAKRLILQEPPDPTKICEFPGCGKPCQPTIWRMSHTMLNHGYCREHYESEFHKAAHAHEQQGKK
jgi:hypothetical protein